MGGFQVIECTVGGYPKDTVESNWLNPNENYDDTMLVAGKGLTKSQIESMPKFGASNMVRHWEI